MNKFQYFKTSTVYFVFDWELEFKIYYLEFID
jgi:hypothetical protein